MSSRTNSSSVTRIGRFGEEYAVEFLARQGYQLLEKNVRTPYGEIDIITLQTLLDSETNPTHIVVFFEVKTRRSDTFGPPEISINKRKQDHMISSAQYYLQNHPELPEECRIDVLAINLHKHDSTIQIKHFENAIAI